MQKKDEVLWRQLKILNMLGLHARSAGKIAIIANRAKSNVWISRENEQADATSIIDLISLNCSKGTKIILSIDDPADIDILNSITELINNRFGEE